MKGKEWLAQKVDLLHHGQKGEHLVGEKIAMKGGKGGPGKRQKTIVPVSVKDKVQRCDNQARCRVPSLCSPKEALS